MASVAVATSMDKEASNASTKFEEEFNFSQMETMIHRFPPGLGEIIRSSYSYMVVPRFVAIGPYHHGKKHLVKTESVKKAAAHYLWQHSQNIKKAVKKAAAHYKQSSEKLELLDEATRDVVGAVDEAHGLYLKDAAVDGTVTETEEQAAGMMKMKDDAQFADMLLCDACFLLLYMHAYTRSNGKDEDAVHDVNESMRRFLFCNRDRINNDIMLLENQLPWRVIQVLMRLGSDLKLKDTVGYFLAAMGSSFKIRESSKLEPYVWDDKHKPPPHLLALLRRHKTEEQPYVLPESDHDAENNNSHPPPPSIPHDLHQPLIHQADPTPPPSTSTSTSSAHHAGKRQEVVVSAISPMDLEQIGITLAANKTEKFSDMGLQKGLLLSSLTLAPLSLSDTRASWLVNMAAFEDCRLLLPQAPCLLHGWERGRAQAAVDGDPNRAQRRRRHARLLPGAEEAPSRLRNTFRPSYERRRGVQTKEHHDHTVQMGLQQLEDHRHSGVYHPRGGHCHCWAHSLVPGPPLSHPQQLMMIDAAKARRTLWII